MQELEKTVEELKYKIKYLEELEEIKEFHHKYIDTLNTKRWDDSIDCFIDDAVLEISGIGNYSAKEGIVEFFKVAMENKDPGFITNHCVTQPVITVNKDLDKAEGVWVLYVFFWDYETPKGLGARIIPGRHVCEYVKVDGKWKYSVVKFIMPWPEKLKSVPGKDFE